jgi:hypothetical protein
MKKIYIVSIATISFLALATPVFADHSYSNRSSQTTYYSGSSVNNNWYSSSSNNGIVSTRSGGGYLFETNLSGSQEVPQVPNRASGNAGVWFGENGKDMNYWISAWSNDEKLTAAHLHCGDPGENGPVVVTLFHDVGKQTSGEIGRGYLSNSHIETGGASCDDTISYEIRNMSELSRAIREGRIYVNVHSQNYPNGVARGQLGMNFKNSSGNWNSNQSSSSYSWAQSYAQSGSGYSRSGASSSSSSGSRSYNYTNIGNSPGWDNQFWRSW